MSPSAWVRSIGTIVYLAGLLVQSRAWPCWRCAHRCEFGKVYFSGWIPLVALMVYVITFSTGFGPIPWLMMGEIFPGRIRGAAASIATAFNWACTFIVTKSFMDLQVSPIALTVGFIKLIQSKGRERANLLNCVTTLADATVTNFANPINFFVTTYDNVGDLHVVGWGEGPWALVTPVKAIMVWVGFYKKVNQW